MTKKILAVLLATAMVAGLAVGCGKSSDTNTETKTEDTKKKDSDGTFTMAIDYMPDSLKPSGSGTDSFTTMLRPLYNSLFYPTGSGMEYYLADKLDVSDDGLTYTVHLNDKATWSDGEPITADDIQFKIDYSIASSGRSSLATVNGQNVQINKIDDKTVEFVLPMVYANFKNAVGDTVLLPGHAFDWDVTKVDDSGYFWNTDMATSGPYVVSEINDDSLVYTARDDYFGGQPSVKKIVLRTLGSGSSKQIAFENGELSYMRITTADELEKYEKDDNYNVTSITEARLNYLQFNPGGAFASLPAEAREAIMLALNDQEIIDAAYGSDKLAVCANSVLTPDQSLYNKKAPGYSQDLEKAKELAQSSGLAGKTLKYIYNADRANMEAVATVVQQQLAAIDVNLEVQGLDSPTFFSIFFAPYSGKTTDEYDIGSNGWDSERGDCGWQASTYMKNSGWGWSEEMTSLVKQADSAVTQEEDQKLWDEIHEKYTEENWVFPLTYTNYVMVSQKNVTGLDGSEVVPEFVDWMSIKVD